MLSFLGDHSLTEALFCKASMTDKPRVLSGALSVIELSSWAFRLPEARITSKMIRCFIVFVFLRYKQI
jgi:hypothetical protein